jgi:hypothetical protein
VRGLECRLAYLAVFGAYLGLLAVLGMVLTRAPVHARRPEPSPLPAPAQPPVEETERTPEESCCR